ncbi:hypothetical protein [Aliiroseovarius sp. YM-037]|uniref:hypothetical protein n=1 Tax=Aliiroseovarius sp. YM-037 TaxID=3341728 RepID=UPI003A80C17A
MQNPDDPPPKSPYDPEETPEEELWFLPDPEVGEAERDQGANLPWPVADRERGDAGAWQGAERTLAVALARAAGAFGALDDRLKRVHRGIRERAVLMQVAELSWQLGDRLSADRIALYLAARITRAGDDMPAFARAGWAMRRLSDGQPISTDGLADLLGRATLDDATARDLVDRPQGAEFAALEERFWSSLSDLAESHPITRGAYAWHLWHQLDLSGEAARIEGAVVAAKIGAGTPRGAREGAGFLPFAGIPMAGSVEARLSSFYQGAETQCLRMLMELDRIAAWEARATAAVSDLSGRTPALLITAFANWPMLSAEALEQQTGASRAAVQRNLNRLADRDLIREVTGQGRFRMWAARV